MMEDTSLRGFDRHNIMSYSIYICIIHLTPLERNTEKVSACCSQTTITNLSSVFSRYGMVWSDGRNGDEFDAVSARFSRARIRGGVGHSFPGAIVLMVKDDNNDNGG